MCEIVAVHWRSRRPFGELLPWAEKVEHYGLGSFGWGVAWLDGGRVGCHRFPGRMSEDPYVEAGLLEVRSTHFLVHFRRPNKLSTVQLADTQPFRDAAHQFVFCHNGSFAREPEFRPRYVSRLHGKADSEVGFRVLEDLLAEGRAPADAVSELHKLLGGRANIGYLSGGGDLLVFNAYPQNRMWRFRSGEAEVAATELHSSDDSLFDLVFPEATDRRQVAGVEAVTVGVSR
jgi:predicted glutamine amidotransferase